MQITYSGGSITPEEVVKFLGLTGGSGAVFAELMRRKEVIKKTREMGLEASDEELQKFADSFRTLRGLHAASDMLGLLETAGLTEDDFEQFCESSVLSAALRDKLADEKRVQEYFVNNRSSFDLARISVILVKTDELAKEIMMRVTEDGEDFHRLAREHSLDGRTKYAGGYLGTVGRNVLSPEMAAKVFNAAPGDLLGPFQKDEWFRLVLVEEVIKPELTDALKEAVKDRILAEWASQFLRKGIKVSP